MSAYNATIARWNCILATYEHSLSKKMLDKH